VGLGYSLLPTCWAFALVDEDEYEDDDEYEA
jgi:hypothetical protein